MNLELPVKSMNFGQSKNLKLQCLKKAKIYGYVLIKMNWLFKEAARQKMERLFLSTLLNAQVMIIVRLIQRLKLISDIEILIFLQTR